ncbi:MAG TPA: DUF3556 domain-containing protein [Candidatus Binatia bacterium]|jgi:hypothetical protein|nr:DUF3556 domain-containing protein [Candidatus Binatia bacterium]
MPPTADLDLPPYDPARVLAAPFPERVRLLCRTWASQVYPTPGIVLVMYWTKYLLLFIGGWAFFVSFSAGYPGFTSPGGWAFTAVAFQKAILWAIFYEMIGFGCGSGPMNARFNPPLGGFLHFLRPGTTKLPLFPNAPVFGSIRRGWLDVALYAANQLLLLRALVAPEITPDLLWPSAVLIPLLGVTDKTLFLAARAEHYWVALVCLAAAHADGLWLSACKAIWCAIWFWAATSKVNHHFPSVIMVMMTNGPFFPKALKRRLFVSYPDDLRPSSLAATMAHVGTCIEYSIPAVLLLASTSPVVTAIMLVVMCCFHGFIALNNPSGMPIEWNILMIYGGIFLFGVHPDASLLALGAAPWLTAFLVFALVLVPAYGNFVPGRVSFLLAMRYYAGNWAYNIWLVRKGSAEKFDKLTKAAGTMRQQLEKLLPDPTAVEVALTMALSHRFMHLEGRPLFDALPRAVDDIDDYEWNDGEVIGGMVLGWNFGDGHLNGTQLLEAVQAQCGFAPGEVRVVMVESQPLFGRGMRWKVADAADGVLAEGETVLAPMHGLSPWPTGPYAEALLRHRTRASA